MHWWQENESTLPKMAQVAKRLLSVPASSLLSERVFSAAGKTVSQWRTALDLKNVDNIFFLYSNI